MNPEGFIKKRSLEKLFCRFNSIIARSALIIALTLAIIAHSDTLIARSSKYKPKKAAPHLTNQMRYSFVY